jgi:hypothetical protein
MLQLQGNLCCKLISTIVYYTRISMRNLTLLMITLACSNIFFTANLLTVNNSGFFLHMKIKPFDF